MSVLAWNCWGLRSPPTVRILTNKVKSKDPTLVFLVETKANLNRMKGFQNKLQFTQGISIPSDGRSGGLALLWKEGTDVRFRSCSNSHIDVVVYEGNSANPWRATRFYGHPDSSKRYIPQELLKSLKLKSNLPWVVFGDFNEITHPDEKLGQMDLEAKQMEDF